MGRRTPYERFARPAKNYGSDFWRTAFARPWVIWVLVLVPCGIEALLMAADAGILGHSRWRMQAYQNGAFWVGLLGNWQPNYAAQPITMFLSYALLHAGPAHLAGNMLVLVLLGRRVLDLVGPGVFLLIYLGATIGGGAGFALLSSSGQPMVGASGALFGLAGALLYREAYLRFGARHVPMILLISGLAVLNLLFWIVEDGLLAWQAHLGGFIGGWGIMAIVGTMRKPK